MQAGRLPVEQPSMRLTFPTAAQSPPVWLEIVAQVPSGALQDRVRLALTLAQVQPFISPC